MSRESTVFLFGLIVFLTPFLGIPGDTKRLIFLLSGVVLMILGYLLRRSAFLRSIETETGEHASDAFVENRTADAPEKQDTQDKKK